MDIGGLIFNGMWVAISHLPFMIWVVLFGGAIVFGVCLRYLTNIKLDATIAVIFVAGNSILVWRAHWIDQGYNEALAQVKAAQAEVAAYKKTNGFIMDCYAKNFSASYLWDRVKGRCLRADGAVGGR